MTNTQYQHTLGYLSQFNSRSMNRKNGFHHRILEDLLNLFSINLKEFKFIQIAGSCGKGSTAHFISSILTAHSYDHGLFTGPHLNHYEERFSCNGQMIDREDFITIVMEIEMKLHDYELEHEVGHMHVMIVIALLYFKHKGIELIVFENGVGGKTDPSNIIDPIISVLTEITLDHSHLLGSTIEDIILDKSCIIKPSTQYVICGMNNVQARNYLFRIEPYGESKYFFINRNYGFLIKQSDETGITFYYKGVLMELEDQKLFLLGTHQVQNASNALAVIEALINLGYNFDPAIIKHALANVHIPCRMELIEKSGVNFLFDGAHNTLELKTLRENIDSLGLNISHIILSISSNKDIEKMLHSIKFEGATFIITPHPFLERNSSPAMIEKSLKALDKTQYIFYQNLHDVMNYIFQQRNENKVILVTGSLYLVGYVKEFLNRI
ncbi:bifunctional folylpolyglutamate synthase/dihydrofolate synthase [Heyndrickxia sp. NPDC080065]|uniref:bifunctional folylpolyglutamate synthase/dihydrofolate synthase n=1 Tax=Heyndrickxia sp. NPDC080065 TaxID=3390568 RepID=UPI003CFD3694